MTQFYDDRPGAGSGSAANVENDVYGSGWNGDTTNAPSQNAVYDKIEMLSGEWISKSANYTASDGDKILGDTSGTTFTGTLPFTPSVGHLVRVRDAKGTCGTNKLVVARNGSKIRGLEDDFDLDWNYGDVEFAYVDVITGWTFATY